VGEGKTLTRRPCPCTSTPSPAGNGGRALVTTNRHLDKSGTAEWRWGRSLHASSHGKVGVILKQEDGRPTKAPHAGTGAWPYDRRTFTQAHFNEKRGRLGLMRDKHGVVAAGLGVVAVWTTLRHRRLWSNSILIRDEARTPADHLRGGRRDSRPAGTPSSRGWTPQWRKRRHTRWTRRQ